ncbi:MAG: hypothetical protein WA581_01165 [Candidatus Acidiferrales bacterium]
MANASDAKRVYQVFSWACLAVIVMIVALVLHKSPAPNVPYDPAAAARVQQKFAAADQAKAAGQPAQVSIDRTELNSYLQQNLQTQGSSPASATDGAAADSASDADGAPSGGATPSDPLADVGQMTQEQVASAVKDVQVDMDGDLIKAHITFNLHGKDMSLDLDGHLVNENGYLKFEPVAGKLGSLPLPQSVLDAAVDRLMSSPENREKMKLPDGVNDIQIVNGQAVVSYK